MYTRSLYVPKAHNQPQKNRPIITDSIAIAVKAAIKVKELTILRLPLTIPVIILLKPVKAKVNKLE